MITTEDKKIIVRQKIAEFIEFMNEECARYHQERFGDLVPAEKFEMDGGRKYLRIIATRHGCSRYVHCFIDAQTGGVYKAAGWKAPALNGERYNLLDDESFSRLRLEWDVNGSYLYKR